MISDPKFSPFPLQFRRSSSAVVLAVGLLALTACGEPEQQSDADASPSAGTIEDLEGLFSAVDDRLECPEDSSGDYHFALPDPEEEILEGRSCAESIVMAWSSDEELISEIRTMMTSAQGELSMVESPNWVIADITETAEDDLAHPGSRDLEGLADDWDATYAEY